MSHQYGGITKPKKKPVSNLKTSDRRLAAGRQPAQYLLSSTNNKPIPSDAITRTSQILQNLKNKNRSVSPSTSGKTWQNSSSSDWDPTHFRIFVGNLGTDVNDEVLFRAFAHYQSLSKVKVVMDTKMQKSKGYGFVLFADSQDYLRALNDMNGKYVGQRPVQLKRAKAEVKKKSLKK